jgi:hypothetical protein
MTPDKLKAWAREHRDLAMTVAKAQAFAQVERERVDAYTRPIFARYGFTDDLGDGHVLADPKHLYLSEDSERCMAYYAECDVAHREHGYRGEDGTCPALVAEHLQIQAESLLLDALARFIGAADKDGHHTFYRLELRAKALELALASALAEVV